MLARRSHFPEPGAEVGDRLPLTVAADAGNSGLIQWAVLIPIARELRNAHYKTHSFRPH
jgi:hypothetical protein